MSRRWFGAGQGGSESRKGDLDAEIETHLAMATADGRERGLDEDAARRRAQQEFGNTALVKDVTRESWGWMWVERLGQDLHYALRQMCKSPGFTAAVIGTLALGIGAATAMFTVLDGVMLRPLPYPHAGRLVAIDEVGDPRTLPNRAPYLDIAEWREQTRSFDSIAFYTAVNGRSFLEGRTATAQIGLPG